MINDDKLSELAKEVQQCKSDYMALMAEVDLIKSELIAIREMIEDGRYKN